MRDTTRPTRTILALVVMLACAARTASAQPANGAEVGAPQTAATTPFLLGPPNGTAPVIVRARFDLHDINAINDEAETFEFTGVLTLQWHDPRQAFDPAVAGVEEKIFQGGYQFDELATGWYPQLILVNDSGSYQQDGVVLRIRPDGTSTLIEKLTASAEAEFNMRRFPFDAHRLEAAFEVLGFGADEIAFQVDSTGNRSGGHEVRIPQWTLFEVSLSVRDRPAPSAGHRGVASAFVIGVDVKRDSFFIDRFVIIPLFVIVLLSFSVFWMDRSSLGDRISVSFIGILTGVAYQIVLSDHLPRISYVTLMHGFLNLSFLVMCATVVVNLVVGTLDVHGRQALGDSIDRRCRWAFPVTYVGLLVVMVWVTFEFY